jgi:myo-inositol-1(or 4)-monophosphatase
VRFFRLHLAGEDMDVDTETLAAVAVDAAQAGGAYLEANFRNGHTEADYLVDDVKAVADREAEKRALAVVADHFPGHATHGEESGRQGDSPFVWVVDPLDGTNNFASDLPLFATAVTAVYEGDPVAAAIYEPLPDTTYVAERGGGARVDGRPVTAGSQVPLETGTVSLVLGLPAIRDPEKRELAETIGDSLESVCKRVLETWSPCVDWGLVADGSIEGIVCFHPDVYEQYPGSLLAAESGVVSRTTESLYVGAGDEATLDELWAAIPASIRG